MQTAFWILLAAVATWFVLGWFGGPKWTARALLFVYNTFKHKGLTEEECLYEMFISRGIWKTLPPAFLKALSVRLGSREMVVRFIILCERTGILRNNICSLSKLYVALANNPDFTVDTWLGTAALPLIRYANAMANADQLQPAKMALELALLLHPRAYTAWSTMALVLFKLGDYRAAAEWAGKVLNFNPDACSDEPLERAAAAILAPGGEGKMAAMLGEEPGMENSWDQTQQQMKAIIEASKTV